MPRTLVWIVVPWLAACGRLAFDGAVPPDGDDEPPVGGCPIVLNLDRARIEEQLVDFPLLVRLGSEHIDRTQLQPDARNLGFYLGGVALAYEIEDAGDPVLAWVLPTAVPCDAPGVGSPGRGSSGQPPPGNDKAQGLYSAHGARVLVLRRHLRHRAHQDLVGVVPVLR